MDIETIGSDDSVTDAEIIIVCWVILKTLGIDVTIQMNSMGSVESRVEYKKILIDYYKRRKSDLCEECVNRMRKNPLRLLDCKEKECSELAKDAPPIIDHLDEDSKDHFMKVLEYLDEFDLPYMLNHSIVRGLDYYTGTTFEIVSGKLGAQNAVCGGGRYDNLVAEFGGKPTPAVGFAIGMDRVVEILKQNTEHGKQNTDHRRKMLYVVTLGDKGREKGIDLLFQIRKRGYEADIDYVGKSLKSQMKDADRQNVKYVLIVGEDEVKSGKAILKNLATSEQKEISFDDVLTLIL